ncbi:hypothetical protein ACFODL_15565 [Phenylobacterium terrae]|uniref:Phage tail protein n=1 Tax=Phenylobacterium terrae TaxID=2665495 RepID=A0ABW4N8F2_9CAUL
MTVQLPTIVGSSSTFELMTNAAHLRPVFGGPEQRVARLGDRWACDTTCRAFDAEDGAAVVAKLIQGVTDKVRFPVQQHLDIGSPGSPAVSSGSGRTLSVSGFTSGYAVKAGQFFNVIKDGKYYLHMVTDAVTASGGSATLSIVPMLKVDVAGATLNFASPQIEGFLAGNSQSWTVDYAESVGLTFKIVESN